MTVYQGVMVHQYNTYNTSHHAMISLIITLFIVIITDNCYNIYDVKVHVIHK